MLLPGLDLPVPIGGVVVDLQLDAVVGDVPGLQGCADAEPVVGPLEEAELETENEVLILLLRQQIAATAWRLKSAG